MSIRPFSTYSNFGTRTILGMVPPHYEITYLRHTFLFRTAIILGILGGEETLLTPHGTATLRNNLFTPHFPIPSCHYSWDSWW